MPSLFVIETALSDLFDTRQEIIAQIAFTDEQIAEKQAALDAVDAAIKHYVVAEVRKVDNIARYLKELEARQIARELEIKRLEELNIQDEEAERRIKQICLMCLNEDKQKRYEGKIGTLRRQGNGGVQPVEVVQPDLVPECFHRATIVMSWHTWNEIAALAAVAFDGNGPLLCALADAQRGMKHEPDPTAIRKELEKRVPCPHCKGEGRVSLEEWKGDEQKMVEVVVKCETCSGAGTVPNGVPGCRLKERGERLVVA